PSFALSGPTFALSVSRVQDLTLPLVQLTVQAVDSDGLVVPDAEVVVNGSAVGVTPFAGYVMTSGPLSSFGGTDASGQARLPWLSSAGGGSGTAFLTMGGLTPGNFFVSPFATDFSTTVTLAGHLDQVPPTIQLTAPVDGATYVLGRRVTASFSCTDETGGS